MAQIDFSNEDSMEGVMIKAGRGLPLRSDYHCGLLPSLPLILLLFRLGPLLPFPLIVWLVGW